jgi:hypothetical protein
MTTLLCDRCGAAHTTPPNWPLRPYCPACIITTRLTEIHDNIRHAPTTSEELREAYRQCRGINNIVPLRRRPKVKRAVMQPVREPIP